MRGPQVIARRPGATFLATAAVLAAALVVVAPPAPAAAVPVTSSPVPLLTDPPDGVRPLPLPSSVDTVVDPGGGHVFVSTGMPSNAVIVTDLAGGVVKVIVDLPNPRGMAIGADGGTLFVALTGGDAVSAIDLVSLTERHRIHTGPGTCPQWLAAAAGKLWVSYGCSGHTGAVAALDTTVDRQVLPDLPESRYLTPPRLAGAGPAGPVLAVVWGWWDGSLVDVFDVAGQAPVVVASRSRPEELIGPGGVAVSPDGSTVFVAGVKTGRLARDGILAFASSDLSDRGFYHTGPYVRGIAVSPDGSRLAAAVSGGEGADFQVFPVGAFTPTHVRQIPSTSPHSVAWSPDGTTAYMPDTLPDAKPALRMLRGLNVDPGRVEVSAPAGTLPSGTPALLSGTLRTTDGTPTTGLSMKVTRSGPEGTRTLTSLRTGPGGAFSLADTPPGPGGYTYRFTWPGDTVHPPAMASGSVRVEGAAQAVLPPPAPGSGSDRALGLERYGALIVDELHQRLLVSGRESGTVAVLDLDGNRLATIGGLPGADGMALSRDGTTLYVAVSGASAIAAVDTDLLVEVGRWSTLPIGLMPVKMAVAGGQVFFSWRWSMSTNSGWGTFRESAPSEVRTWDEIVGPTDVPTFATSPAEPDMIIAGGQNGSVYRMDAATTPPTVLASHRTEPLVFGSKVSPDGNHVLRSGGSILDAHTLSPLTAPSYADGTSIPYAGAYTADGAYVAVGGDVTTGVAVRIWPRSGGAVLRSFGFPGGIPFDSLAFSSDSSRLYAVTTADRTGDADPVLHVRNWPLTGQGSALAADLYHPLAPSRLLDTRSGNGAPTAPLGPGSTLALQVAGRGGVPSTGVSAVVLNLTAVDPTADGHLTAWPAALGTEGTRPLASNVNFRPGQTVANLALVKVGASGAVNLFNAAGRTHVVADVAGWYGADPVAGARFTGMTPARIVDTRHGTGTPAGRLGSGSTLAVQVTAREGVPATGVSAVVLNVTAVDPTAENGYLTAWPAGSVRPLSSNLNFYAGRTVPNLVVAKVGAGGMVNVFNAAGQTDLVVDIAGWYGPEGAAQGSLFSALPPSRLVDTRYGNGAPARPMEPGSTLSVQVTGRGGVPAADVAAVAVNVTAVNPTATSYLTAWPKGVVRPLASNLNLTANQTVANMVIVSVGDGGIVQLFNAGGHTDVIVDVAGWYGI